MTNNNLDIKHLSWDSDFFGIKVGRLTLEESIHYNIEEFQNIDRTYDLVYIISPFPLYFKSKININLVDIKITYKLDLNENYKSFNFDLFDGEIIKYDKPYVQPDLEELTYQAGVYSRFRIDPNFNESSFKKLYKTWIENSVKKIISDDVICCVADKKIVGFITVKFEKEFSVIGLIGVNESFRGKQIGTKLIDTIAKESLQRNITNILVDTQKENQLACRFYEKNGFKVHKEQYIYHYWRNYDKL